MQRIDNVCEPAAAFWLNCWAATMQLDYVTLCLWWRWHLLPSIETALPCVSNRCLCVQGCVACRGFGQWMSYCDLPAFWLSTPSGKNVGAHAPNVCICICYLYIAGVLQSSSRTPVAHDANPWGCVYPTWDTTVLRTGMRNPLGTCNPDSSQNVAVN